MKNFKYKGKMFNFRNRISLSWLLADEYYGFDYEPLDIHIREIDKERALISFYEELDFLWFEYVLADDTNFEDSALKLRERLIEIVDVVREFE